VVILFASAKTREGVKTHGGRPHDGRARVAAQAARGRVPRPAAGHDQGVRRAADGRRGRRAVRAGYGERTPERVNYRNGYGARRFDTRAGTIDLEIPRLRTGSYFPDWLITPRRRAEQALLCAISDAYLAGVSTRRVDKLVRQLGVEGVSKSQVSEIARRLDETVEAFRQRGLSGPTPTCGWTPCRSKPRRRPAHQRRGLPGGGGGQRPGPAEDPRRGAGHRRGRGGLAQLPAGTGGPGAGRGQAGHLRRPPRLGGGRRIGAARAAWQRCRTRYPGTCSRACPSRRSPSWPPWCARSSPSRMRRRSAPSTSGSFTSSRSASGSRPRGSRRRS
jgi:Transposase, Mutator family